ncbi:LysM peptidoglycan-binding domain-containing protein [Vibrio rumoiensis]|uniref:Peptidoglycan-binding protein n=1 Tax=Vibrio rumoiensis 1S-45 TaxID=1188252 RepID=A0A1E5E394_9VIBR|nr:LysM peptidoglycan-binding domain-containing protein [Vibrio rumoiensis]OEF26133.1 peptidoglycan-binding protein [Vibrio rumoiensis 1S-45]
MRYLLNIFAIFVVSFSISAATNQQPLVLKQDAPTTYVVKKGDTLWDISALFLDSPWLWPRLWQVNPEISNPHLIYPGDRLTLTWRNGEPLLSLKPMKKVGPHVRKQTKDAIPTLADGLVMPYLKSDLLLTNDDEKSALRVLGTSEGRKFLSHNERIYIDGKVTHPDWTVYRLVEKYDRSGDDVDASAYSLRLVARATLKETSDKYSGLQVINQQQEIMINDIALPVIGDDLALSTVFFPTPAPAGIVANIKGSVDNHYFMAVNQVVVIDRGADDGLSQGSTFDLAKRGAAIYGSKGNYRYKKDIGVNGFRSAELPAIPIGQMVVIRPYAKFSLALITKSDEPIEVDSIAISPIQFDQTKETTETAVASEASNDNA